MAVNLDQVKPAKVREWLDVLRQEPGWEIIKGKIGVLLEGSHVTLLRKEIGERDADFCRGEINAYQRVLGMCREILEEMVQE